MKTIIPTVSGFAFVQPFFDYLHVEDISPSLDADCVGYVVFGWFPGEQSWEAIDEVEDEVAAREIAAKHHDKIRRELEINADVEVTTVEVEPPVLCDENDPDFAPLNVSDEGEVYDFTLLAGAR